MVGTGLCLRHTSTSSSLACLQADRWLLCCSLKALFCLLQAPFQDKHLPFALLELDASMLQLASRLGRSLCDLERLFDFGILNANNQLSRLMSVRNLTELPAPPTPLRSYVS